MSYFSRLTDIITCNLTELLSTAPEPGATLTEIIHEMEEGLAGAQRSVQTAERTKTRLEQELQEAGTQAEKWGTEALAFLRQNDENAARMALYRKKEAADLQAGLEQQVRAAHSNCNNLMTTYRALEARLAEANRKWADIAGSSRSSNIDSITGTAQSLRHSEVEDELAALKRSLDLG